MINGTIMDAWQMPLEDVGPAGVDGGKGGKYVILPPGYDETVPEGFIALPSLTCKGYALLRSILESGSDADLAKAVEYGKRIKVYPLSQAASPPETVYVDAERRPLRRDDPVRPALLRGAQPRGADRALAPARPRDDRYAAAASASRRASPSHPTSAMTQALEEAAAQAHDPARREAGGDDCRPLGQKQPLELSRVAGLRDGGASGYADPDVYPIDDRGVVFTFAFFTPKRLGEGQFYLMVIDDKAGSPLDGAKSYRLTVPANAPVRQYWSATVYDRRTHALVREMPHAARSSQSPGLPVNPDGALTSISAPRRPPARKPTGSPTRRRTGLRGALPVLRARSPALRQDVGAS